MAFRTRAVLRGLLVCGWSVVAGVLAFEGVTRMVGVHPRGLPRPGDRGGRGLWVYDANLGWFHAPGSRSLGFDGDRGEVRINNLGLRGPEASRAVGPGVRRILVLGDSFVFGFGLNEEDLFSSVLARRLGQGYEVLNLGVSGYSTDQEYLLFESLGSSLGASVVVLVMCDNDFEGNTQDFVYRAYYKPYFEVGGEGLVRRNLPVPQLSRDQKVRLWLGRHSNTWHTLLRATSGQPGFTPLDVGRSRPSRPDVDLTFALVAALRRRVEATGAALAIFNTGHRGENTRLFQELRTHLRREDFLFLGLEGVLGQARARRPTGRWDFGRDAHWNVEAHRLAAEIVHGFLAAKGLVPSR